MQIKQIDFVPDMFLLDFFIGESDSNVLIVYKNDDRYYPINSSLEELSKKGKITAIIFDNLPDTVKFFLSLKGINNLNIVEIIRLLILKKKYNLDFLPEELEKYERYLPVLDLDDELINLVEQGLLFPEIALLAKGLKNIQYFLEVLKNFRLTFSEQREVLTFIKEKGGKIDLNNIKKKEELLKTIKKELYPEYTKTLDEFNSIKKRISLPKNIALKETPYFEKKDLKIEITFKNIEELINKIEELKKNIKDKEKLWKELINLL